jgi:hypothetical protein
LHWVGNERLDLDCVDWWEDYFWMFHWWQQQLWLQMKHE